MTAAPREATYQDVLNAPPHMVAEVLAGELYLHPRPAGPHTEAASVLGMDLGSAFHRGRGGPGGWIILNEPELHLERDIIVPDLAGWKRSRLPTVPRDPYIELAPDWVCEVLSPRTTLVDRRRKLPIYLREKVTHVWLVDPIARYVEVFRREGDSYRHAGTFGDRDTVRIEPFDAIELELDALWPNQEKPPSDEPVEGTKG